MGNTALVGAGSQDRLYNGRVPFQKLKIPRQGQQHVQSSMHPSKAGALCDGMGHTPMKLAQAAGDKYLWEFEEVKLVFERRIELVERATRKVASIV